MPRPFRLTASVIAALFAGTATFAQDCPVTVESAFDLEEADIKAIYSCIEGAMAAGYAKGDSAVAAEYRKWTVTSTRPAVAGPHGNRLLQTFANDIAAEEYLKFAEEGVAMPVGSILAKESIAISKKKKAARIGPLFIMTKVEAGAAPDTNDWVYDGIQPNGKPMKFKQAFCHDCHAGFESQDYLAYPLEEVRVSN